MHSALPAHRSPLDRAEVGRGLLTLDGLVREVDRAFAAILGRSPEELVGRSLREALGDRWPTAEPALSRALSGERVQDLALNGGGEPWLLSLHPVRSRLGTILGLDLELRSSPDGVPASLDGVGALLIRDEGLLRRLWERATFGVLVGVPDGSISYANPALAQMLGYRENELQGRGIRWQDLTPPECLERDAKAVAELLSTGSCEPYEKAFRARDGHLVPVLIGASLLERADNGRVVAAYVTDLSELKAAEAEQDRLLDTAERARGAAEAAARRTVALLSLTAALSRALTPARVAEAVIEQARSNFDAAGGAVVLLDRGGSELHTVAFQGFPSEVVEPWLRFSLAVPTPLADAARRGEPVFLSNSQERDRRYPGLERYHPGSGAQAWAALPLLLDQQVLGALGVTFAAAREFDADERTYLMTMAGLCAQALERARLSDAERDALAAADEALAMLDTVVDSAPIGLAYVDREFRYRRVNPRLAAMNGLPVAAHLGKRARDLFPNGAAIWEPHWRQVVETGEPVTGLVLSATLPDGQARHAQVSFYPVRVGDGPILGVGVLVIDITKEREAEEERTRLLASEQAARAAAQEAQARAEAALQLRDSFLSVAAHELKTPLTSLLGQAQLLERRLASAGLLTEQNARSLQVVVGQARRLNHLIGDLLDGAQLELGQLLIKRRPLELGRLAKQIVEELQPTAPGHSFRVELPDGPVTVHADPMRMEQVVQNLLSNAVKYSPRGSEVVLTLRCVGDKAQLAVHDQGVGIQSEAMPHLFERFFRAPNAATASVSGVGVGLYVVREIVRLHEGEVWVESVLGQGSTFTVELPLAEV